MGDCASSGVLGQRQVARGDLAVEVESRVVGDEREVGVGRLEAAQHRRRVERAVGRAVLVVPDGERAAGIGRRRIGTDRIECVQRRVVGQRVAENDHEPRRPVVPVQVGRVAVGLVERPVVGLRDVAAVVGPRRLDAIERARDLRHEELAVGAGRVGPVDGEVLVHPPRIVGRLAERAGEGVLRVVLEVGERELRGRDLALDLLDERVRVRLRVGDRLPHAAGRVDREQNVGARRQLVEMNGRLERLRRADPQGQRNVWRGRVALRRAPEREQHRRNAGNRGEPQERPDSPMGRRCHVRPLPSFASPRPISLKSDAVLRVCQPCDNVLERGPVPGRVC